MTPLLAAARISVGLGDLILALAFVALVAFLAGLAVGRWARTDDEAGGLDPTWQRARDEFRRDWT